MSGTSLQVGRRNEEHRFYDASKARRNRHGHHHRQYQQSSQRYTGTSSGFSPFFQSVPMDKAEVTKSSVPEPEKRSGEEDVPKKIVTMNVSCISPSADRPCNLERFLKSTTPVAPARYPSKVQKVSAFCCFSPLLMESNRRLFGLQMKMGGCMPSGGESRPYFVLADLWESFAEWSAYGAGVPLVLNSRTSVIQYYVPFLSGIQLYSALNKSSSDFRQSGSNDCMTSPIAPRLHKIVHENNAGGFLAVVVDLLEDNSFDQQHRHGRCWRPGDESDGDSYRDSSSDLSSDHEHEKRLSYSKACGSEHVDENLPLGMDCLCWREKSWNQQEGSSSDDGDCGHSQPDLLFEYLEQDPPFVREPLFDKISDLAGHFPALKSLKSCDLLPSSWISVAWYPIYRIPTGPTLKDLDACFLTFHSLSPPMKVASIQKYHITGALLFLHCNAECPTAFVAQGVNGVAVVSLPTFGLASYKFRGSIWTPNGGREFQLVNSLVQEAEKWVRRLNVDHPDYSFFASRGATWR
ncbi:hypothetical protein ZIOFF_026736 [Zingiber officinale]|uniref:Uncharacterized protein n=1 Tax=Zingiber officinale TaxID=94328 RepID=A0A8J5H5Q8_ZINOF|nr:hypothetical protein ZIOFF_026736 [Zingiber officinale]